MDFSNQAKELICEVVTILGSDVEAHELPILSRTRLIETVAS